MKVKFKQKKRLGKQLDYLVRYLISMYEVKYQKRLEKITLPKELIENLIIPNIKINDNDFVGFLYGINLKPSKDIEIKFE